jgi:hypothetical protein
MGETNYPHTFENRERFRIGGTPPYAEFPIGFQSLFERPLHRANKIRAIYETVTGKVRAVVYHTENGGFKLARRHHSHWMFNWRQQNWADFDENVGEFTLYN